MMLLNKYCLVVLALLLSDCGVIGCGCTTVLDPGIEVTVRDAITDDPIAENAIGILTSDDYREVMNVVGFENSEQSSAFRLAGAWERPGKYNIYLSVPGYQSWSRRNVEVIDGICHVSTVEFTARLEKL